MIQYHYIVQLGYGVWLIKMEGDPGTLVFESAQKFKTQGAALQALNRARKYRPYYDAVILRFPDKGVVTEVKVQDET